MSKIIKYMSKNIQECHFIKIKNPTSKVIQELNAEKNVDTSRCWTGKQTNCNIHIYHFHILESPHLDFSKFWGWGGLIN